MRFLEKSRSLAVDSIAYDLEDSVTPSNKPDSRENILSILNRETRCYAHTPRRTAYTIPRGQRPAVDRG